MKKLFAAMIALCLLLCSAALAEETVQVNWSDYFEGAVAAADVAGGFVFSPHVSSNLFNSRNCEYYLQKEFSSDDPLEKERERYFQRLTTLLDLSNINDKEKLLSDICFGRRIKIGTINNFLRLTLVKNYQKDELLSLLFYLGYLTIDCNSIKTVGSAALICPNKFMEGMFREYCEDKNIDVDIF